VVRQSNQNKTRKGKESDFFQKLTIHGECRNKKGGGKGEIKRINGGSREKGGGGIVGSHSVVKNQKGASAKKGIGGVKVSFKI